MNKSIAVVQFLGACSCLALAAPVDAALPGDDLHLTALYACRTCGDPADQLALSDWLRTSFRREPLAAWKTQLTFHEHDRSDDDARRFTESGYGAPYPRIILQRKSKVLYTAAGDELRDVDAVSGKVAACLFGSVGRGRGGSTEPPMSQPPPLPPVAPEPPAVDIGASAVLSGGELAVTIGVPVLSLILGFGLRAWQRVRQAI